jgi:branched-chain amino acid transport system permease protein
MWWPSSALVLFALLVLPHIGDKYTIYLVYLMFIYMALGQSWNLVAGYTGLVNLGVAAFFGLGAYTAALTMSDWAWSFYLAILASGGVAMLFAAVVSLPMFRFRGIYFAIGTLVLAEALRIWMINWSVTGGAQGLFFPVTNIPSPNDFYYAGLALAAGATAIIALILRTKLGVGLRAIRDNEDAAQNMGVNTFRVKLYAFALSAFIAGVTGGVQAAYLGTIEPYSIFSITWTITAVNLVIIGGMGTLLGPIVGAVVVTELQDRLSSYPNAHLIITGIILIVFIRFVPAGIVGQLARLHLPRRLTRHLRWAT